jgi:hypothetical protein
MRVFFSLAALLIALALAPSRSCAGAGSEVKFNPEGIAVVNGKPFFPLGIFTYELNPEVIAEIHELRFNTVLNGFGTNQLDMIQSNGLMAVCFTDQNWIRAATNHPALLAWYLEDEPENRGVPAASEQQRYQDLKSKDPRHPIGLCHTSFEALTTYKNACDFTMTDIYPITAKRDQNVMGVSIMIDESRRIHGPNWPQWTYIQSFGGPETDAGVWAVPLPHELRFMVYQALVHRATGILYFSYWPRQPRLWQALAGINREVQQLIPWLVSPGREEPMKRHPQGIQVRIRISASSTNSATGRFSGGGGLIMAINTTPRFVQGDIECSAAPGELQAPFEQRRIRMRVPGVWRERFAPYEAHVYTWGSTPEVDLFNEAEPGTSH